MLPSSELAGRLAYVTADEYDAAPEMPKYGTPNAEKK